ncbi:MAG: hypothetical protein IPK85_13405 [Gemmatimonadetes bacterium]|nr:hypothetical protein [Gemmatimonadota bacterium]
MSGITLGLVAAITGTILAGATSTADASDLRTLPWVGLQEPCEFLCRSCGTDKHDIVQATENKHKSSHLENCNTGECTSHETCDLVSKRLEELWPLLNNQKGDRLRQLVSRHADVLAFNAARGSIQVRCTKGELIANLPLTDDQRASLEAIGVE